MELIDYSYYKDVYCGSLEETAFSKVYPKALAYFAGATRGRVKKADTNVCFALCELCDVFYEDTPSAEQWAKMGVLGVEMESAALYCNAARAGKKALCICTVSDSFIYPEENTTAEERQNSFTKMMEIALELA